MKNNIYNKNTWRLVLLFNLLNIITVSAQDKTSAGDAIAPNWMMVDTNTLALVFLFIIMALTILVLYRVNIKLIYALTPKQEVKPGKGLVTEGQKKSSLSKVFDKLTGSVPVAHEKDILLDHDYDGIKELDNNLPPWWKYGFYLTIIFAFVYLVSYHVAGFGKLQIGEYDVELVQAEKDRMQRMTNAANNITEENVVELNTTEALASGKEVFEKNCAACHLVSGAGQVGPNLTDDYWIHGGGIKNIFKTIVVGVPAKGMISWKAQLSPKQIQQVSSYILTLRGTNPAGAKEPQGDLWEPSVKD